ncbi:MAG: serine protease Do [Verrucomicrobiota bacterium]|jgi:regulator of sirC expression with transglutaminase-like and TPR domain
MSKFPCVIASILAVALLAGCNATAPTASVRLLAPQSSAETNSIEQLTAKVRDSIVVITHYGRDGREDGVGAGFVISRDGLVATSLHVIGEARPIRVQFANGQSADVTEVHATDRKFDLAILRIAKTNLPALRLGDSDLLQQGTAVIALGNPLGLQHSVVQGVVSARREIEGIDMIQLAIPIEPGNSGGPLLDMKGRVHGILTLKSALSPNLGFAMPVNHLKALITRPNPIPMNRWLTLGALNPRDWTPLFGARWSQKAGRIVVDNPGTGFGGRSLCLATKLPPARPFEIAASVRLGDEGGAAGIVFGADGQDRHFAFYPSAGQMRLTRFDGPNVFAWHILKETPCASYKPGEWNHLRVRVDSQKIHCYVNGESVCEIDADEFPGAQVGLAKFRDTHAEFRNFQVGTNLEAAIPVLSAVPEALRARVEKLTANPDAELIEALQPFASAGRILLAERARLLERDAATLRELSARVHCRAVQQDLVSALALPENQIDLAYAALLVAKLDNPDLDPGPARAQLKEMGREISAQLPPGSDGIAKLEALRKYLFIDNGFHGSRSDFYHRANSYLDQVLDDREGLPITLSVVFMELAREIGLQQVVGLPLPGHFMVKYIPTQGTEQIIDVFDGGKTVTLSAAQEAVLAATGEGFRESQLKPATKREIIVRMLHNLQGIAEHDGNSRDVLRYLDVLVALSIDSAADRLLRARMRIQNRDIPGAREDLKWILDHQPDGVDLERVLQLYEAL